MICFVSRNSLRITPSASMQGLAAARLNHCMCSGTSTRRLHTPAAAMRHGRCQQQWRRNAYRPQRTTTAAPSDGLTPYLQTAELAALTTAALLQVALLLSSAAQQVIVQDSAIPSSVNQAEQIDGSLQQQQQQQESSQPQQQQQQQQLQIQALEASAALGRVLPAPMALMPFQGLAVLVAIMCNALLRRLQAARCAGGRCPCDEYALGWAAANHPSP